MSAGFFPLRVFGNIKTFTVEFDIPSAELSVQMEIRGGRGRKWVGSTKELHDACCIFVVFFFTGDFTVGQIKDNLWSSLRCVRILVSC